jgi:phosphocarrier protein
MPSTTVTVGSAVGLHARPAAIIAQAATELGVPVTLATADGEPVDAGSALLIMTLGAGRGDQVTIESDDAAALEKISGLVAADLDA